MCKYIFQFNKGDNMDWQTKEHIDSRFDEVLDEITTIKEHLNIVDEEDYEEETDEEESSNSEEETTEGSKSVL